MKKSLLFCLFLIGCFASFGKNKKHTYQNDALTLSVKHYVDTALKGYSFKEYCFLAGYNSEQSRYMVFAKVYKFDSDKTYTTKLDQKIGRIKKMRYTEKSLYLKLEDISGSLAINYYSNIEPNYNEEPDDYLVIYNRSYFDGGRLDKPKSVYAWVPDNKKYPIIYTDEEAVDEDLVAIGNDMSRKETMEKAVERIKYMEDSVAARTKFVEDSIDDRRKYVVDSIANEKKRIEDSVLSFNKQLLLYDKYFSEGDYIMCKITLKSLQEKNNNYDFSSIVKKCDSAYNDMFISKINNYIRNNQFSDGIKFSKTFSNLFDNSQIVKLKMRPNDLENLYFLTVLNRINVNNSTSIEVSLDSIKEYYPIVTDSLRYKYKNMFRQIFILKRNDKYIEADKMVNAGRYDGADSIIMFLLNENKSSDNPIMEPYNIGMDDILNLRERIFNIRVKLARKDTLKTRHGNYCIQLGLNLISNYIDYNIPNIYYFNPNISFGLFHEFNIKRTIYSERNNKFRYKYNLIGVKGSVSYLDSRINTFDTNVVSGTGYYIDLMLSSVVFKTLVLNAGVANNNKFVLGAGFRFSSISLEGKYVFNQNNIEDGKLLLQIGIQPNFSFGKRLNKSDYTKIDLAVRQQQNSILDLKNFHGSVNDYYHNYRQRKFKITGKDVYDGVLLVSAFSTITCLLAANSEYEQSQTYYKQYNSYGFGTPPWAFTNAYSNAEYHRINSNNYYLAAASTVAFDFVYGIIRSQVKKKHSN